jgi:hypothetical protein
MNLLEMDNITKKARWDRIKGELHKMKLDFATQPTIKVVLSSILNFAPHENLKPTQHLFQ